MSRSILEILISTLDVNVVRLIECLVSPGWRLSFPAAHLPAIHYNLSGRGHVFVGDAPAIPIFPHTLVIAPPHQPFRIEAAGDGGAASCLKILERPWQADDTAATVHRYRAGEAEPEVMLICGYFRAFYGTSIDLFGTLHAPIVEQFGTADTLDAKLSSALAELRARQIGMEAMTTALLKQVLVTLIRRSLYSADVWLERFSMLSDPNIARAFTCMLTEPGAAHSVLTLSQAAGLSRSAFMARFAAAVGCSPMAALRQLRMHRAAAMLSANLLSLKQIAHAVGYTSPSSFFRAFRQTYGKDPLDYRASSRRAPEETLAMPARSLHG
jgi:AraC family transcriptional activator of mtrCDE